MTRTRTTPKVIACLGDSLTFGAQTPAIKHPWPERLAVNPLMFPNYTTANHGKNSDILSGITTRFERSVLGQGYTAMHYLGPINDIQLETAAGVIWEAVEAIVDAALDDGMIVFLGITTPAGNFAAWNGTRQGILEDVRDFMLAKADVTVVDWYTLMGDPDDPTKMLAEYDIGDGLHYSAAGCAFIAQHLAGIIPGVLDP